jgi:hypothetical protein
MIIRQCANCAGELLTLRARAEFGRSATRVHLAGIMSRVDHLPHTGRWAGYNQRVLSVRIVTDLRGSLRNAIIDCKVSIFRENAAEIKAVLL